MKPFDDLTHDDLIALTEEQIAFYIDRECAEQGVPLLPSNPPQSPEIEQVVKSVAHYCVAGLRFSSEDEARRVAETIRACKSRRTLQYLTPYAWNHPQHDGPIEPDNADATVTLEYVYDADGAARQKAANDAKKDKKDAYDAAKKEYDRAASGRDNIAEAIRSRIHDAWTLERRRRSLLAEYQRYIPLANGDKTVAKRFLQRAHDDARRVLPDLFPDGWNDEPPVAAEAPADESEVLL